MQRRHLLTLGASALVASPSLLAQGKYPQRPITLVVPTAPGGSTDFTARLVSDQLSRALGQPVIVDNKPGASGNIGNQFVARAKPDGYTLLVSYSGYHVGNPHLFKQAGWDPIKDFAPVAMMTRAPQVIAVSPKLPANNLRELIAYAKANPGKLNYASSGNGSIQHIAGELFKQLTGTFITHIPYRGSGPAVQDLMGGQVDIFITTPAGVVSQIQGGRLKGLAVTSKQRLSSLPSVPTAAESGLKGYELDSWFALYAPAGTPGDIVQQLNAEVNKILLSPEARKKAEDSGTVVEAMTPAQLADFTKTELAHWGQVIKGAKITLE
ncbi:MAG: Bug family tripartite tricarboxylate transporter substrate binding protein [Polaromonas sp.]